jgi:myo-inositol-1(or 4)-monophosphatase
LVAAAVYELGQDEYFAAELGRGARCNGNPIRVSPTQNLKESLVATGFPYYDFSEMTAYNDTLHACFRQTRGVRRLGSAATDLAYVACGRFEAFFEHGLSPWDVAAGILLVREAGGWAGSFGSHTPDDRTLVHHRELVAGNDGAGQALHQLVQHHFQRP